MDMRTGVTGLDELSALTQGDPSICIAVLDGPVDLNHPCFHGADIRRVNSLVSEDAGDGTMSLHGTHVASLIFGQPGSAMVGVAPRCRGLVVPVFTDSGGRLSQIDLARAIERAVAEGADIVSISGGQRSDTGDADVLLTNALRLCETEGVLVVAAVGNDGADCVHVPAGLPTALAVGATDAAGRPLSSNNWGAPYRRNGLLAIGDRVTGAAAGGGVAALSGSSVATPVVAGLAALLAGLPGAPDLLAVRAALLSGARGEPPPGSEPTLHDPARMLAGLLDLTATRRLLGISTHMTSDEGAPMETQEVVTASAAPETPAEAAQAPAESHREVVPACSCSGGDAGAPDPAPARNAAGTTHGSPVFVIGSIGHDFGTEANRDVFIGQMPDKVIGDHILPANPYDPVQLTDYLRENPWASDKLTWICKHESMPIYALEAEPSVGMAWSGMPTLDTSGFITGGPPVSMVHKTFWDALSGQALRPDHEGYISRVSVPGRLTDRTVRLFSGQVLPVVQVQATGLYTWSEALLIESLVGEVERLQKVRKGPVPDADMVRAILRGFLDKVYFQFRNLGASGPDRALNFAATNAFPLVSELANGFLSGHTAVPQTKGVPAPLYTLDDITVRKSQYARHDSECYDVIVTFFDPTNDRQAKVAYLYTVDVSTVLPVSLAPTRQFLLSH